MIHRVPSHGGLPLHQQARFENGITMRRTVRVLRAFSENEYRLTLILFSSFWFPQRGLFCVAPEMRQ